MRARIKACLQAASDGPARFTGVWVLGATSACGTTRTDADEAPRELTGITDHPRGRPPTARLNGPGPRKAWHRIQELAGRARRTVSLRYPDRDTRSPPKGEGSNNTIAWPAPRTQPACPTLSTPLRSPATRQVRCAAASSKICGVILTTEYYYRRAFITRDQVYTGLSPGLNTSATDAAPTPASAANPH